MNIIRITNLLELRIVNDDQAVLSETIDTGQREEVWIKRSELFHVGAALCAAALEMNNEGVG